jgi:cobalt-zinc-cadmium efflux system membrane fusion protein
MQNTMTFFTTTAMALMIMSSLLLTGCDGGKPDGAAKTPQTPKAAPKEAGHHDGDHAESDDGEDKHPTGKHEESEHEGGHEEGHGEEGVVALTPAQIKAAGIELATVSAIALRETLPLYGAIVPNAERVRDVAARFPGTIRRVDKKIGDAVRQGEVLATVESNESLQTYNVTAPLAGVVTARNANAGEQTGEKPLFTVADLSTVWVELSLFPRDVAKVRSGQSVRVKNTDAGLSATGPIVYVAPIGTSANQTLTARVVLDNAEHRWVPGLYVTADVTLSEAPVPLAIRNDAVQTIEGRISVFVQGKEGFEAQPIRLGRSDGEYTEVLEGVAAGATYVTANSFVLKAELTKGEAEHEH